MQRGDRLVVQVDLVDASNERQIWGERLNRASADIFEVEDAIAQQIVEQLPLKLAKRAKHQTAGRSTDDPLAYDCICAPVITGTAARRIPFVWRSNTWRPPLPGTAPSQGHGPALPTLGRCSPGTDWAGSRSCSRRQ